jgi:hypothetical protein
MKTATYSLRKSIANIINQHAKNDNPTWAVNLTANNKPMQLKIGDRVTISPSSEFNNQVKDIGTGVITKIIPGARLPYGVKSETGTYNNTYSEKDLILVKTTTIMKNVSNMFKKLTDSKTQTLYKAGYINGDLELTTQGTTTLMELMFTANKDALVTQAETEIAEAEKAEKKA